MRLFATVLLALALSATGAQAAPALSPAIQPLGFLIGHWLSDAGHAEGGRTDRGEFSFEPVAGGAGLLRRDHTELVDPAGKVTNVFDQVMLLYPENGDLHADYFDGTHAIHYVKAEVEPGKSVRLLTATSPGPPAFRLTYRLLAPDKVSITFEIMPPGQTTWRTVAEGSATRTP